jgi:hypothetical protein
MITYIVTIEIEQKPNKVTVKYCERELFKNKPVLNIHRPIIQKKITVIHFFIWHKFEFDYKTKVIFNTKKRLAKKTSCFYLYLFKQNSSIMDELTLIYLQKFSMDKYRKALILSLSSKYSLYICEKYTNDPIININ